MIVIWLTFAVLSVIIFGLAGWFMKVSQVKQGSVVMLLTMLYIFGTLGFAIHMTIEGSYTDLHNIKVWLMGILIGIGSTAGNYVFMKALAVGPASLTSPMSNLNIVLVVTLGTFYYKEPIHWVQLISIALLLLATVLIAQRKEQRSIVSSSWYWFVLIAIFMFAIRNGGLKITAEWGYQAAPVLFVAYLFSIMMLIIPCLTRLHLVPRANIYTGLKLGMISGICSYGGMQLYALALEQGPANMVAPIFATNGLLTALLSIIIYKEKLSRLQWVAFLCLIAGLIGIRVSIY